ncbi:MAG: hypothetical protein HYZ28_06420 [Myxococcales bacterium]|nr:hypothetical protein [Myxococcales bacterium]
MIRRRGVGVTSVYCLAEVAGVMSFVQPPHLLRAFVRYFAPRYGVRLWPTGIFQFDVAAVIERASRRMGAGDATVLWHAETCRPPTSTLVTWNTRDFAGRTNLRLMTPQQYLRG